MTSPVDSVTFQRSGWSDTLNAGDNLEGLMPTVREDVHTFSE